MSRYLAAAVIGLLVVSCQKEKPALDGAPSSSEALASAKTEAAADATKQPQNPPCAATKPKGALVPVGEGGGGTLVLARAAGQSGPRTIAIAADEDDQSLHVLDVDSRAALGTTKLPGKPSRLVVTADGRIVVSLGDKSALAVLEPDGPSGFTLAQRCLVETPAEPMGLAITPNQETLLVVSRWGHALSALDLADMTPLATVELPRDPTSVMASSDGKRAFVTHAAGGVISVVELGELKKPEKPAGETAPARFEYVQEKEKPLNVTRAVPVAATKHLPRPFEMRKMPVPNPSTRLLKKPTRPSDKHDTIGSQAFTLVRSEKGVFAPLVMVEPRPPMGSASGYGSAAEEAPAAIGEIALIDEATGDVKVAQHSAGVGPKDCFLPRAAAIDEARGEILVACLGIDSVVTYDAKAKQPHAVERRRVHVPLGPTGLAIDPASRRAVVFSSFSGQVTFIDLEAADAKKDTGAAKGAISVVLPGRTELASEIAHGRALFHGAGRRNISFDGRACASCHPDGRDDGLTWQTQEGPRQTPILLGRLAEDTAPFGWLGDKKDLPSHFARTVARLSGTGVKKEDREAIFAYVKSLRPPEGRVPSESREEKVAARGKEVFHSAEAGCASCHIGGATTDGERHNVSSAAKFEIETDFETPSLRFIARSAPYFHDGRYATLKDMIDGCDGTMGNTKQLAAEDKAALAAYLETL